MTDIYFSCPQCGRWWKTSESNFRRRVVCRCNYLFEIGAGQVSFSPPSTPRIAPEPEPPPIKQPPPPQENADDDFLWLPTPRPKNDYTTLKIIAVIFLFSLIFIPFELNLLRKLWEVWQCR